jgi:proteic killer suppression protein
MLDDIIAMRYHKGVIRSFKCRETKKVFERLSSRRFPGDIQQNAQRKLWVLDAATEIGDLLVPPGNRLESLKGERKGQYSIRINQRWRICFKWRAGHAYEVEIVDYH